MWMWKEVITVFFTALIGPLLVFWVKQRWKARKEEKKNVFGKYMEYTNDVYSHLERLRRELKASRVAVLKLEDGGGIPQVGHKLYSSVLWESVDSDTKPLRGRWERQEVDKHYIDILTRVFVEKKSLYQVDSESNQENSILYNLCKSDAIATKELFFLFRSPTQFIYLVVDYKKKGSVVFQPENQEIKRNYIQKMINVLERMEDLS